LVEASATRTRAPVGIVTDRRRRSVTLAVRDYALWRMLLRPRSRLHSAGGAHKTIVRFARAGSRGGVAVSSQMLNEQTFPPASLPAVRERAAPAAMSLTGTIVKALALLVVA
jgi:hypothetical protein